LLPLFISGGRAPDLKYWCFLPIEEEAAFSSLWVKKPVDEPKY